MEIGRVEPELMMAMGLSFTIFILLMIAFFFNKFLKHRQEIRMARIQSGKLDPMKTEAGAFLIFRRGILLIFLGINFAFCALLEEPTPLIFIPFTLGAAYLTIYYLHSRGWIKLFPGNGSGAEGAEKE